VMKGITCVKRAANGDWLVLMSFIETTVIADSHACESDAQIAAMELAADRGTGWRFVHPEHVRCVNCGHPLPGCHERGVL